MSMRNLIGMIFVILVFTGCNPNNAIFDYEATTTTANHPSNEPSEQSTMEVDNTSAEPPERLSETIYIVFDGFWHDEIYLLDYGQEDLKLLYESGTSDAAFWGISKNKCNLYVGPQNVDTGSVLSVNYEGEIQHELFKFNIPEGVVDQVYVSPDEVWIAYSVGRWIDSETDPDLFDLFMSPTNSTNEAKQLSLNGGVTAAVWLKNGNQLVYAGNDSSEITQVFLYDVLNHELNQITNFEDPSIEIGEISVSPNDALLIISVGSNNAPIEEILLIEITKGYKQKAVIKDLFEVIPKHVSGFWWDDENTFVTKLVFMDDSSISDGLYWIDLAPIEVKNWVDLDPIFGEYWSGVPFGDKILVGVPFPQMYSVFDVGAGDTISSVEIALDFNFLSNVIILHPEEKADCID